MDLVVESSGRQKISLWMVVSNVLCVVRSRRQCIGDGVLIIWAAW